MAHYTTTGVRPSTTFQYGPMLGGPQDVTVPYPPGFMPGPPGEMRVPSRAKTVPPPPTGRPATRKAAAKKGKKKVAKKRKGRSVKCKNVTVQKKRRKLCWDKHGKLVSNKPVGRKKAKGKNGRKKKVVCKTKCPKGSRRVCVGGYRAAKKGSSKRVCKKFVCKRRK